MPETEVWWRADTGERIIGFGPIPRTSPPLPPRKKPPFAGWLHPKVTTYMHTNEQHQRWKCEERKQGCRSLYFDGTPDA